MKIANIDREIIYIFWKTTRGEEGGGGQIENKNWS